MKKFRAPAVPLLTNDPFFSVWSFDDKLYDNATRHWSGIKQNLLGLVSVDGETYRFMGLTFSNNKYDVDPIKNIEQISVDIMPYQTIYKFGNEKIELCVKFTTPLFLDDLDVMSRTVSYIDYNVSSVDGQHHEVEIFIGIGTEISTNDYSKKIKVEKISEDHVCFGLGEENLMGDVDDMIPGTWGWYHVFASKLNIRMTTAENIRKNFHNKYLNVQKCISDIDFEGKLLDECYVFSHDEHKVSETESFSGYVCVGYDDIYSMEYFGERLKAYYQRKGLTFLDMCELADKEHDELLIKAERQGKEIYEEAFRISSEYADIISLAYRQVLAGHKLVTKDGKLLYFSKECGSNGCTATVDITYPSMPMFLLYNPELVIGMLNPVFDYVKSGKWEYEFAPHDVGRYPFANGQMYGDMDWFDWAVTEENRVDPRNKNNLLYQMQMPVEECGNIIICVMAVCRALKDFTYAKEHFNILKKWADYLLEHGFNPVNQLCTDDFGGRLEHNCNLSVKSIIAIASFARICEEIGEEGENYRVSATEFAGKWERLALSENCFKLTFDNNDSWSLKYNMVWDDLLGLNLFSQETKDKETALYKQKMLTYGIPLDCRENFSKTDWQMWIGLLDKGGELEKEIIERIWKMANDTKDRVPFTDWYYCTNAGLRGFRNRTVQGGLFINLLARKNILR